MSEISNNRSNEVLDALSLMGIIPVIKIDDLDTAVPLANALYNGGLRCAEVTFRTKHAVAAIKAMTSANPDMLVGAGTVLTTQQVDDAVVAGARFIVSPGFDPEIVKHCKKLNIPVLPGCTTATEVTKALNLGLNVVKFFPAEQSGGLDMIKALSGPFTDVKFIPTGGIDPTNLVKYLKFNKVLACGGSWMVKDHFLKSNQFETITAMTKDAINLMLGFEPAHLGINAANEEEALKGSTFFANLFGTEVKSGNSSIFAGTLLEVMKAPYLGCRGHYGILTNSIPRAMYHLGLRGANFRMDTAKYDADDNILAIYLEEEFWGHAVHLLQKK